MKTKHWHFTGGSRNHMTICEEVWVMGLGKAEAIYLEAWFVFLYNRLCSGYARLGVYMIVCAAVMLGWVFI